MPLVSDSSPEDLMYRKSLLSALFLVTVSLFSVSAAVAQSVTGVVELEKDGVRTPLAGAKVDLYREDIKGKGQTATTGADGKFSFANVEAGFKYLLAVSGPGAGPNYFPEITSATKDYLAIVGPGGGETVTEDQLKAVIEKQTPEERKKYAEQMKKAQEILSGNAKIENATKLNQIALDKGIPALNAKKYDEAIAMFDAAINASPDYEGSAPVFLNAKAVALKGRARDGIAAAQKLDTAAKNAAREKATPDYALAIASYNRGLEVIAKAPANTTSKAVMESAKKNLYSNYVTTLGEMYETNIPVPEGTDATKVLAGYIETETDPAAKAVTLAKFGERAMSGDLNVSAMAFKKALEANPKDLDVLGGAVLAMGTVGITTDPPDKAMIAEAKRIGKLYLDSAPETHPKRAGVVDILDNIKASGN
jgi:tetratricopeptide (TPR) repeat protein